MSVRHTVPYEEMAQDSNIDLFYIAVPYTQNYRAAKLCLEYGKPVLIEKGFAADSLQAKELFALAWKKNLLITEAIWVRYHPMRKIIFDTLNSGVVGEPRMLEANLGESINEARRIWYPEPTGVALMDFGINVINFAEMFFGHAVSVTAASNKNEYGIDINDIYVMTFENGNIAVLHSSEETVLENDAMFYCMEGCIRVKNISNPETLLIYDRNGELIRTIYAPPQLTGYEYVIEETVEALRKGLPECESMPHFDTIHLMEFMDEIRTQMHVKYFLEDDDGIQEKTGCKKSSRESITITRGLEG